MLPDILYMKRPVISILEKSVLEKKLFFLITCNVSFIIIQYIAFCFNFPGDYLNFFLKCNN